MKLHLSQNGLKDALGIIWNIHSLSFLEEYSKLRVLEIGEVDLNDLKGIDKLIGLEKLSIWSN